MSFDTEDGVSLFDPAWFAEGSKSKRFKGAPAGTSRLLALMFAAFVIGLTLIVAARLA